MNHVGHPSAEALRELSNMEADRGVLSVYVDADPLEQSSSTPAWEIRLKNEVKELRAREHLDASALDEALERADSRIADMLRPATSGRVRVLFESEDLTREFSFDLPLRTRVEFGDRPFIRPLLRAVDRGAPFGVLAITNEGAATLEWSFGTASELCRFDFANSGPPRERKGPAAANPARGQQSASHDEEVEAHLQHHLSRGVSRVVAETVAHVKGRSWTDLVFTGPEDLIAEAMRETSESVSVELHSLEANLSGRDVAEIADEAADVITRRRSERRRAAVTETAGRAAGAAGAAGGVESVSQALIEGRVSVFYFDDSRHPSGAIDSEGRVANPPPAESGETRNSHVIDHLAKLALASGAEIVPLAESEAAALAEHDGIVVDLRW